MQANLFQNSSAKEARELQLAVDEMKKVVTEVSNYLGQRSQSTNTQGQ